MATRRDNARQRYLCRVAHSALTRLISRGALPSLYYYWLFSQVYLNVTISQFITDNGKKMVKVRPDKKWRYCVGTSSQKVKKKTVYRFSWTKLWVIAKKILTVWSCDNKHFFSCLQTEDFKIWHDVAPFDLIGENLQLSWSRHHQVLSFTSGCLLESSNRNRKQGWGHGFI